MNYILISLALLFTPCAFAREYISNFEVDIRIRHDASVLVRETITVYSERKEIIRGIIRDIPNRYLDFLGTVYEAPITIQSITLDGAPQAYVHEKTIDGISLTIRDEHKILAIGFHTFVIEYIVYWQIGFFDHHSQNDWFSRPYSALLKMFNQSTHDSPATAHDTLHDTLIDEPHEEFEWNAIGTNWNFTIENAQIRVQLPEAVPAHAIQVAAFRGTYGERETIGLTLTKDDQTGIITCAITKPLPPLNGLYIVVGWPSGFVDKPSRWYQLAHFVTDNPFFIFMLVALLIIVTISIVAIIRMRLADRPNIIIPLFYPPHGVSPALARFIVKGRCDEKCLAAEIVQFAVDGLLTINYQPSIFGVGTYTLKKIADITPEAAYVQQKIFERLFHEGDTITLAGNRQARDAFAAIYSLVESEYERRYAPQYFDDNGFWISLVFLLSCVSSLFIILGMTFSGNEAWFGIFIGILVVCNLVVNKYSHTYSRVGRAIADQLSGFRLFLVTAETERLRVAGTPPTKTPELYEKYLPYAFALDAEQAWSYQFAPVFAQYVQVGKEYAPTWFGGSHWSLMHANNLGSQLASAMHAAIAQSARGTTARPFSSGRRPGSGSGFGGGGSVGSGGGGGGGRGV